VLEPVLFLIYINDLDSNLINHILYYCIIHQTVREGKQRSGSTGQSFSRISVDYLSTWSVRWQIPFNTEKCKVMHLGRKNMKFQYAMDKCVLQEVTEEKDLGVFVSNNLKPARQCHEAYSKASKALGMIVRTISYRNTNVLLKLYKSMVRPYHCRLLCVCLVPTLFNRQRIDQKD